MLLPSPQTLQEDHTIKPLGAAVIMIICLIKSTLPGDCISCKGLFCRKCPKTHQSSAPGLQKCLAFPWELRNLAFTTKSMILLSCTLPIYQVPSTERVRTILLGSFEQGACNIVQSGVARAEAANKILLISMHVNLKVQIRLLIAVWHHTTICMFVLTCVQVYIWHLCSPAWEQSLRLPWYPTFAHWKQDKLQPLRCTVHTSLCVVWHLISLLLDIVPTCHHLCDNHADVMPALQKHSQKLTCFS